MQQVVITKGLPASGKSTWARQWVSEWDDRTEINRDDIRKILYPNVYKFSKSKESEVTSFQESMLRTKITEGMSVVISDTNLNPKTVARLEDLVKSVDLDIEIIYKDFTDVPLVVCIERDAKRSQGHVGESVIINMYQRYLADTFDITKKYYEVGKPYCIVCDIDGTVADNTHRNPHDYTKIMEDKPINSVITLLNTMEFSMGMVVPIIYASGRPEEQRDNTHRWLESYDLPWSGKLLMRPSGCTKKDYLVKEDMAHDILKEYNILFWLDDRWSVTYHLRSLGIKVFSVDFGRF